MTSQNGSQNKAYQLYPIGQIERHEGKTYLSISEAFRPALKQLDQFSHVMVFWWAERLDADEYRQVMQTNPPYAQDQVTGIFATRSPQRPNPIAMTTCKLFSVDETAGMVEITDIDAFAGTPIVDLKAYFPVCDRVETASIPSWLAGWPEWMPEDGIGLMEHEQETA